MKSQINVFVPLLTVAVLLGFFGGFAARSPSGSQGPCVAFAAPTSEHSAYPTASQLDDNSREQSSSWARWAAVTDF
jgi:hypothetical protein